MNENYVCNFAVVRFLPYPETDEFVNVGVVMACAQTGLFDYRIETRRRERITGFFPELDVATFLSGRRAFLQEMHRVKAMLNKHARPGQPTFAFDQQLFTGVFRELVRARESVFRFGGIGAVMTDQPERKLDELFAYYVERQFARREEYAEALMTQRLTETFRASDLLGRYHEKRFGDEVYQITIPFVHEAGGEALRAIKPLALNKDDTTRIIEYGDKWCRRIERLRGIGSCPQRLLFVLQKPASGRRLQAAEEVRRELRNLNVETLDEREEGAVLEFARAG